MQRRLKVLHILLGHNKKLVTAIPWMVLLVGMCLAAAAGYGSYNRTLDEAEHEFNRRVERVHEEVQKRFRLPVYGLNGAKGFFAASSQVRRSQFVTYVESRNLPKEFPGVRGFGFIERVPRAALESFVSTESQDGAPQFEVRQLDDKDLADLLIIKFIEPIVSNAGAQGLDIGSEKSRRKAAEHAIDSGETTMTGPITLVQDERKTPGALLFVPVYARGVPLDTVQARRASLRGLLYAPIVIDELLKGMTDVGPESIDFELIDQEPNAGSNGLIYDHDGHTQDVADIHTAFEGRRFFVRIPIEIHGRHLVLQASSTAGFDATLSFISSWLLFAGLSLTHALFALLLYQEARGKRRAEMLAQQMNAKLLQDEERSRDFSRSASDWFWETDAQHRFCYFSDNFEQVYGVPPGRLLGKSRKELIESMSPQATPGLTEHMACLDSQLPFKNFEYQIVISSGVSRWISVSGVPHLRGGVFAGYRGTGTLITERKKIESALLEAKRAAEQASQAKSNFLATMSHEIRTPMNGMLGMLNLLSQSDLTRRQLDYTMKAEGATKALLGVINDILDFSKVEAGKLELNSEPMALDQVMSELSVLLSASLDGKKLEMLFDQDPSVPQVILGDALRLRQVLLNLAGNAIKFTEQGEVVIAIRQLHRDDKDVELEFEVRDTGIGISADKLNYIFEGFSQAESSTARRFGGTGLGLAISQRLVSLMGGKLAVVSEMGRGSRFHFSARFALPSQPDGLVVSAQVNPMTAQGRPMRVLLVEDNSLARRILRSMAASEGWLVHSTCSGEEALEHLRQTDAPQYDLVLMDWWMPGLDGWSTIKQIRHHISMQTSPLIIMVTASGRDQINSKPITETSLIDGYLVKPITSSMLREAVSLAMLGRAGSNSTDKVVKRRDQLAGLRLLVVEDNPLNQQIAKELLESSGARVSVADNGQIGVAQALAATPPFDAILMDMQMPDMDGLEATRHIRSVESMRGVPIIAMTANVMETDRDKCQAAGMVDHVAKPVDLNALIETLLRHVRKTDESERQMTQTTENAALSAPSGLAISRQHIDVDEAIRRLGGDRDLYALVVKSFCKDAPDQLARMQHHISLSEYSEALMHAHTLKGLSATVGAPSLAKLFEQAEAMLREMLADADISDTSALTDISTSLATTFNDTLSALQ